jgi:hypothetical protein
VAGSAARNTGTTSVSFGSAVNYVNYGMTVVVADNCGTPATGTLTATPSFTAGTATTTSAKTSRTFAIAKHTVAGSYANSSAVTWSGFTSPRSGLMVAIFLNYAYILLVSRVASFSAVFDMMQRGDIL